MKSETVEIDAGNPAGPMELWRHTIGIGGINPSPLPGRVAGGLAALKPRLIRIFIQEFFHVYPEHGRVDWSLLDPYMRSLAETGAKVVAAICIKPKPLYPGIDHKIWRPTDVAEWQWLIEKLVRRYSVDQDLVRYWEIGNETDIGESGGAPFLIPDPAEYKKFFDMTAAAVRRAASHVKVGGPASCWVGDEPLPGFVQRCRMDGTPLDFVSWHIYDDDWGRHRQGVETGRKLVSGFAGQSPELLVTEWNKGFPPWSVEEGAYDPRCAALAAAAIIAMDAADLTWSFYYHALDQVCDPEMFATFMSEPGVEGMYRHWNEVPHRFGLFGVQGEVRPQYFLYKLLASMGEVKLPHTVEAEDVHVVAGLGEHGISVMIANTAVDASKVLPRVVTVRLKGLSPGPRMLTVYRIDDQRRWRQSTLELRPSETRRVDVRERFEFQVQVPADSVAVAEVSAVPPPGRSSARARSRK